MHFLDAWNRLPPSVLTRVLAAPACVGLSILLPGRRAAALASVGLAIVAGVSTGLNPWSSRLAWAIVWLACALVIARGVGDPPPDSSARRGGVESGAVGLLLGIAMLLLLIAAVARQDLPDEPSRDASYGLLMIGLGLVHLMLRRHVLRAAIAFGSMGMGLDRLTRSAASQQLSLDTIPPLAVPFATAIAIALVTRIARSRLGSGGGAWVSGAHDLHD
ncbi:MAG: hypothetical protein HYR73_05295 [Candidatus Eisenbacteria bacterium]|nr:hypothetical protein [Candidatus Eisenbacteria bacterium]